MAMRNAVAARDRTPEDIYEWIGPLSDRDVETLRQFDNDARRKMWCNAIYGRHAMSYAFGQYQRQLRIRRNFTPAMRAVTQ